MSHTQAYIIASWKLISTIREYLHFAHLWSCHRDLSHTVTITLRHKEVQFYCHFLCRRVLTSIPMTTHQPEMIHHDPTQDPAR